MTLHTVKRPQQGDVISARDTALQLDVLRDSVIYNLASVYALRRAVGPRTVLFEVVNLSNPGVITAQLSGDPAPIPVNYLVLCDPTWSETSRDGVTYVYTDFNNRTADGSEVQKLTPSLNVGDTFLATAIGDNWRVLEIGGRQWARVP